MNLKSWLWRSRTQTILRPSWSVRMICYNVLLKTRDVTGTTLVPVIIHDCRDHYRMPSRQNYPDHSWSRDSSSGYNSDRHRAHSYRSGSQDNYSYNDTQLYDRSRRPNRSYTRGSESQWRQGQSPCDWTYTPPYTNNNGRNYSGDRRSPDRQRPNYPAPRRSYSRSPSASRNPSYSPHRRVSFNLQENEWQATI